MPAPSSGGSAPRYFLKIAEIKGDARTSKHEDEIEVSAWSWGETQSVFPAEKAKGTGSVSMRDFEFTMNTGAASAQVLLHCASAKRFKSAVLTCEQDHGATRHKYLTITFTNVVIGSYEIVGARDSALPTERVTLKFTKIEFAFTPPGGGNFTSSWDLSLNTA
jgi:type VI secretion system secreted protein Hcp